MKLHDYLIIVILIIGVVFYFDFRNQSLSENILKSISTSDSLKGRDQVIERYYTTEKTNTIKEINSIENKWDSVSKNMDSVNCNLKLAECVEDIKKEAQMVQKAYLDCDSSIASKKAIISEQENTINLLKNKKVSPFGVYSGIGLSLNKDLSIQPSLQLGLGINLDRLFKK